MDDRNISRILLHNGEDDIPYNAVIPPLTQTSIFSFASFDEFREALADEENSLIYTRGNNPVVNIVEEKLAALEHAEKAKLVASGISAITLSILAFVESGAHIVCVTDTYSWTKKFLINWLPRFGVTHTFVDGTDPEEIAASCTEKTKIIYLESPTTFTFKLQDLKAVSAIARRKGVKTIIDNTWATPIFQNPIDFGIDIVVHSASKYLGGHSDVVAGIIAGSKTDMALIFDREYMNLGPVPDPFMAWLLLRGLRTLEIRMLRHFENAKKISLWLAKHPKVESVLYPFAEGYLQSELAGGQMRGGSGLLSFTLKMKDRTDEKPVKGFSNTLKVFRRAVSWGGFESLVVPFAVTLKVPPTELIPLVRLHIGLEDPVLLVNDLDCAFKQV